ncbi:peroxisomal membrane protein PEX16-like [Symsagittifera roscoffensis]|uniref:peroxisomal membrane protein PEX16-like n=1 Tax=Symsagittifera roscoffensis TaxID=84072 RepID=UPI00307B5A74
MTSAMPSASDVINWIGANQKMCSRVESTLRLLSYFLARKQFAGARPISELMYSASSLINNLLSQISNPHALYKSLYNNRLFKSLKMALSALECFEVFFEVSVSEAVSGDNLRWTFIAVIEAVKFAIGLFLLLEPKLYPRIKCGSNQDFNSDGDERPETVADDHSQRSEHEILTMPRSKIRIRTIAGAAKEKTRTWKLNVDQKHPMERKTKKLSTSPGDEPALNTYQYAAEALYLSRPIMFLASRYISGGDSYKPWFVSFVTEMSSLILHDFGLHVRKETCGQLASEGERKELKRRTTLMLLYMLRSPFYENICEQNLTAAFLVITSCIPGSYIILKPLMDYLPQWQKAYFNVWGR